MTTTLETDKRGVATGRTWSPTKAGVQAAVCQHIAVSSEDPEATASFLHEVFGLPPVRTFTQEGTRGVVLTDGFIEVGLYKFSDGYLRSHNGVPGRTFEAGFTGFHHLGFSSVDAEQLRRDMHPRGRYHPVGAGGAVGKGREPTGDRALEAGWVGPDKLLFALSEAPWTEGRSLGPDVARIRHIGIASHDPYSTLSFFRDTLGMRVTDQYMFYGGFADGYSASDGNVEYALLRFSDPYQHAHDDSRGLDVGFTGIHHIGFYVTDIDRTHALLAEYGCHENMDIRAFLTKENKGEQYQIEEKYNGPDRLSFEVNGVDWKVPSLQDG